MMTNIITLKNSILVENFYFLIETFFTIETNDTKIKTELISDGWQDRAERNRLPGVDFMNQFWP
jgi:hypothetical protein